jgi:SAM-dependent methyltransferase
MPASGQTSAWDQPSTVSGFASSAPNPVLLGFLAQTQLRVPGLLVVDIGCGAGRNAVPIARLGARVVGLDLSAPMLEAARRRDDAAACGGRVQWIRGVADRLPLTDATADLVIAHGVWNLSRSGDEFRRALREAARVARPGAGLFVFTFSRHTLPTAAEPVHGETFVFTQFSGQPQCFLTEAQLVDELDRAGFVRDPATPLTEYNRPAGPVLMASGPVIYEGTFRRR